MTPRERLLAVYRGETPDKVPLFADLSHWHVAETGATFTPIRTEDTTFDAGLFDLHRELGIGCYLTGANFWRETFDHGVSQAISLEDGLFRHAIETPIGRLEERREYSPISYSYDITQRMVRDVGDLEILRYAYQRRHVVPAFERFAEYDAAVGDMGIVAAGVAYGGLGFLMSRYMGVEATVYALADHRDEVEETMAVMDAARLREVEVAAASPAHLIMFGDNLSSDLHTPPLFDRYMRDLYTRIAAICHQAGKPASAHLDGRMRGLLSRLRECGFDGVDAVTPAPDGDLTPQETRDEAGPDLVLLGGVPASVWQEGVSDDAFDRYVIDYLALRRQSPRLVIGPGDQVVPGTPRRRLRRIRELVEQYGRYD